MYRIRRKYRIGALLAILTLLLTLVPAVLAAETASASTMQLTKTEGTVSAVNASGRSVSIREKMRIYNGYTIKTEAKSYAWIALDDTKLVKLDAASEVEVRKNGKSLELLVSSGSLLFNVTEPLKEDETLNICTATMVAGVRGTTGWVEENAEGSGLSILEGKVVCKTASGESTSVESGQSASFSASGEIASGQIDLNETPGFVLTDVVNDPALCAEIMEKSGLDIGSVTPEQAAAKQAKDEAAAAAVEAANQAAAQQPAPNNSSDNSSSDSSDSGSSNGGSTVPGRPAEPENPGNTDNTGNTYDTGDFIVNRGTAGKDYSYENHVLTIKTNTPLIISSKYTSDRIVVSETAPGVNVTLIGVQIEIAEKEEAPAFLIPDNFSADVNITLKGDNKLKGGLYAAGLQKNGMDETAGTLTITGTGTLTAEGGANGAGIGGASGKGTTRINIQGGTITATGGIRGAGIGGGYNGDAGEISISGGMVIATGGKYLNNVAAGIGGCRGGINVVAATIDDNAFVDITTGETDLSNENASLHLNNGIVIYRNGTGTFAGENIICEIKGNVDLCYDAEIPEGATLTIPEDSTLTIEPGVTLKIGDTIVLDGESSGQPFNLSSTGDETGVSVKDYFTALTSQATATLSLEPEEMEIPAEDETPPVSDETPPVSDETPPVSDETPATEDTEEETKNPAQTGNPIDQEEADESEGSEEDKKDTGDPEAPPQTVDPAAQPVAPEKPEEETDKKDSDSTEPDEGDTGDDTNVGDDTEDEED